MELSAVACMPQSPRCHAGLSYGMIIHSGRISNLADVHLISSAHDCVNLAFKFVEHPSLQNAFSSSRRSLGCCICPLVQKPTRGTCTVPKPHVKGASSRELWLFRPQRRLATCSEPHEQGTRKFRQGAKLASQNEDWRAVAFANVTRCQRNETRRKCWSGVCQ
jgi:hypothetical protein